jgi:hypothetical protein
LRITVDLTACHRAGDNAVATLFAYLNQTRPQVAIESAAAPRLELANLINGEIANLQPILNRNCVAGSFGSHFFDRRA